MYRREFRGGRFLDQYQYEQKNRFNAAALVPKHKGWFKGGLKQL